jgi:hypothetical protein
MIIETTIPKLFLAFANKVLSVEGKEILRENRRGYPLK